MDRAEPPRSPSPIAAIVGTAPGAGNHARARHAALTGAIVAGGLTETIGLTAALHPDVWLGLFGDDPAMLATGSLYLRVVGPFYGFFGFGLVLDFAAQGAGRVGWPLAASLVRMAVALGGAWLAAALGFGISGMFPPSWPGSSPWAWSTRPPSLPAG